MGPAHGAESRGGAGATDQALSALAPGHVGVLLDGAADAILTIDDVGRIVQFNRAAELVFGWAADDVLGEPLEMLLPPRLAGVHEQHVAEYVREGASAREMGAWGEVAGRRRDGSEFPAWATLSRIETEQGVYCTAIVRDITDQRRLEEQLRSGQRFTRAVLDGHPVPTAVLDAGGNVIDVNRAWRRAVAGSQGGLPAPGGRFPDVLQLSRLDRGEEVAQRVADVLAGRLPRVGTVAQHDVEAGGWYELAVESLDDGAIITVSDVTEREEAERVLAYRADHDELTGLVNRARLVERTEQALASSAELAVVVIDLDGFKAVNDRHGHLVGDRLLTAAAARARAVVREGDVLGRIGGDEFAVVCPDTASEDAAGLAERLLAALREPFQVGRWRLSVGASAGVAGTDGNLPGVEPDRLLGDASAALYRAKGDGRGRVVRLDESLRAQDRVDRELERRLGGAAQRGELRLRYQPVCSVETGRPVGVEALVRWWDAPAQVLRSPNEFIDVAERSGAITEIGGWVLEEACRQARAWREEELLPHDGGVIAVNLSAVELCADGAVERILETVQRSGLAPADLCVELTEGVVLDRADVGDRLAKLRAGGVTVALDDFGTGYASLAALQRLPIDVLKIDRGFTQRLADDGRSRALVAAIIDLAHALDIEVVAEGIETGQQAMMLTGLGCRYVQGYRYAAPLEAAELRALLDRRPRASLSAVAGERV